MNRGPTVLVVEDHNDLREGLSILLQREGYAVETALDGRDALNKLQEGLRPQLIVLDLMMPVMNGFEFRQQQLRWPDLRDIPVIVYSGVTDATRNARHLNAAAYVGKPIDLDGLLQLVRRECPT